MDRKAKCWGFMHFMHIKSCMLIISILLPIFMIPATAFARTNEEANVFQASYKILNQNLYVTEPRSLYDYYGNISHRVIYDDDYPKFVTPQAVEPIAENIQRITRNLAYSDEQFADYVLTLVHQIPYVITGPKYPGETLADNSGDCVALSLLAASIMKAGGLDVVLIHYTGIEPGHMNVGVYLPYTPVYHNALLTPTSYEYNNKTYWTAEATPEADWKIGDQSGSIARAIPVIIPLDDVEKDSPARVSSSLSVPLLPSSITINASHEPSSVEESTRVLTISGSISPTYAGQSVSVYVSRNGSSYDYYRTLTDDFGKYNVTWDFTSQGTYYVTADWSGTLGYAGADSDTLTVFVGPESFTQFQTEDFSYIFGQASAAIYEIRPLQGVDDFLNVPLGGNVSFSCDFIVVQTGHIVPNVQTKNVTIPAREINFFIGRNRQMRTIEVPEKTVTVPVSVPPDLSPLRLPSEFDRTINNQFCFLLQNDDENYSLNVRALNDFDMSTMTQENESNTALMNSTASVKENTWYTMTANITANGITATLYDSYGTLIKSMATPVNAQNSNSMAMLIANNVDNAVIFKDLRVQAQTSTTLISENAKKTTTDDNKSSAKYINFSILLVATLVAAIVHVKKKRQIKAAKISANLTATHRYLLFVRNEPLSYANK
jgi:hypothetical protein